MHQIVVIAHDIRSTHNVGSLLRTAEGLGIETVYFTGYTPYPAGGADNRLPHLARKLDAQIHKTALGAEKTLQWKQYAHPAKLITQLRNDGYTVLGLEQTEEAVELPNYAPPSKIALLLGREVEGIEPKLLKLCDKTVQIPMFGSKESFNVVQAAGMALYHLRFYQSK